MASQAAPVLRFLLPRYPQMSRRLKWTARQQFLLVRFASSSNQPPPKPIVLEKPARFNPPSHGSRLPKKSSTPRHYGGDLSKEEVKAQESKEYPGMMAPKGTWAYWFWNNRTLHLCISLGTLLSLAAFTFVENFRRTSPFAAMMPSASDFLWHPFSSISTVIDVVKLSEVHNAAIVQDKRTQRVDDVAKRKEYRKAHGIEEPYGLPFLGKVEAETERRPSAVPSANAVQSGHENLEAESQTPRKKWLGIL